MIPARALRLAPPALASAVVGFVVVTRDLGPVLRAIALGCAALSFAAATLFGRPEVRAHGSVVLGIAALTAAGQVDAGPAYAVGCAVFLVVAVIAMRRARATAGAERAARPPPRVVMTFGATGLLVTASLLMGLPWLAAKVERKMNALFGGGGGDEETAFSTTMALGSTRGMLQSDAVALRIDGERPEYLRGAVYDRYHQRYWSTSGAGRERTTVAADAAVDVMEAGTAPRPGGATRITLARGAPQGHDMRWFLPQGACDLGASGASHLEVDAFGIARRARAPEPLVVTFRTTRCTVPPAPVASPGPADLEVPRDLAPKLRVIAAEWTRDARSDRARLDALVRELGRFTYSLAVARNERLDPILDFVTEHRAGHCEMFASAMVLMARTQGIAARVAAGYRVTEVNPLTGRAVVRDRDAHAWVEAWVDGGWHAWDPTPMSESLGPRRSSTFENVLDAIGSGFDRGVAAVSRLGPLGVAASLAGAAFLLYTARAARSALVRWRSRTEGRGSGIRPLPCFESLAAALAEAGHERPLSEPIERYARRVAAVEAVWAREAAAALIAYADLRYGGIGDEPAVAAAALAAARAVRRP